MVVQHSVRRWFQHVSTILPMLTGWLLLGKWHAAFGFLCRQPLGFHCCVPSSAIFHWCCQNWIGSCWQVALDKVHSTTLGYRSLALSKCSLKKYNIGWWFGQSLDLFNKTHHEQLQPQEVVSIMTWQSKVFSRIIKGDEKSECYEIRMK